MNPNDIAGAVAQQSACQGAVFANPATARIGLVGADDAERLDLARIPDRHRVADRDHRAAGHVVQPHQHGRPIVHMRHPHRTRSQLAGREAHHATATARPGPRIPAGRRLTRESKPGTIGLGECHGWTCHAWLPTFSTGSTRMTTPRGTGPGQKRYRLADARRERDWSQERAAREIYNLGIKLGYRERDLGVDTRMVSGWERGAHHPKPHYVRILCKLYQLPEELLDLAPDVQEADAGSQDHVKNGTEDDPLQRRVFVTGAVGSLVGMTGLSDLARALTDSDAPAKAVTEHDCARHLAWGMWQSGRRSIHASELPSRIAQYLDK